MDNRGTIIGIRLHNYKAFQDTGWIEFNKFTLLYGYNSNGKSTILKFLYQLKMCINSYRIGMSTSLWSEDLNSSEGGFLELLYRGQEKKSSEMTFSFKMLLNNDDDSKLRSTLKQTGLEVSPATLIYTVSYKYNQKGKKVDLRSFSIYYGEVLIYQYSTTHTGGFKTDTDFQKYSWNSNFPLPSYFNVCNAVILEDRISPIFKDSLSDATPEYHIHVRNEQGDIANLIYKIKAMINDILINYTDDFEYFYPARVTPKRMMKLSLDNSNRVGASGENTYNVLYAIEVNKETAKKDYINDYLKMFGYQYEWRVSKNGYGEFLLVDTKTKVKVNILDCGFGISQILPIIVSCFDDNRETLAIDSPDAHLHAKVHGEICDLLINTSQHRNVIVETHSENILLRLQRRIVEKNEIFPEMATIYFITDTENGTVCKKITFDEYGDLVNAPDEFKRFFSSSFEDVMSIAKAKGERIMEKNGNSN